MVLTSKVAELPLLAFEQDVCFAYTRSVLLRGGPVDLACDMIDSQDTATRFKHSTPLHLLRQALLSLATTFFGMQHRQTRMIRSGYVQYGEVLRQLNVALSVPEHQATNETILTALTCMLMEVFLPTGHNNFLKHHHGIEALMQLRGPPKDFTGDTATIFRSLRILSIIGALAKGAPSLYTKDEWKRAPMAATNEMGALQHRIFTILAECSKLVHDRNRYMTSETNSYLYDAIMDRVKSALEDLSEVLPLWQSYNMRGLLDTEQLSSKAIELGIVDHIAATVLMLYYTAQICIIGIRQSLNPSPENDLLRDYAAGEISKCLELKQFEQFHNGLKSNTIGFVVMKVAWQALGDFDSSEGRQLASLIRSAINGVYAPPPQVESLESIIPGWESSNEVLDQYLNHTVSLEFLS